MTVAYDLINNGDHTLVKTSGELNSLVNILKFIEELMKDIVPCHQRNVLIDNRDLSGDALNSFDNYDIAAFLDGKAELRRLKMAVVVPPSRFKALKALETFIRNRGFCFLGFCDIEDAEEWLVGKKTSGPRKNQSLKKKQDCANYS
ncbi:hypothetical protein [Pseudodesulfovibrio sp. zrk46]|uniref:hypothetical protein n=1 Tax=Pseudodesulfovibrio sp. zrk46 TaxID=2725288 RepID=UPI00144915BE|nr:hypothetical protein [Pseudodesulfovibrio sp. zrk46]QJB55587.1 hypothetical protein HFN16_03880 [Pseudodesulfovibrio sp. zrk46]